MYVCAYSNKRTYLEYDNSFDVYRPTYILTCICIWQICVKCSTCKRTYNFCSIHRSSIVLILYRALPHAYVHIHMCVCLCLCMVICVSISQFASNQCSYAYMAFTCVYLTYTFLRMYALYYTCIPYIVYNTCLQ